MEDEILKQLNRIERNTLLSSKTMLTPNDVVMLTGLSKFHLYKLTCTHRIPFYKPNGKQIYFDKSEVEAWLKRNRVATEEELTDMAVNRSMKGKSR
jgi:excisionase family DNA binding protein